MLTFSCNREQERVVLEQQIAELKSKHVEENQVMEDMHSKSAEELNETLEERSKRLAEMEERCANWTPLSLPTPSFPTNIMLPYTKIA
jgi:hypothetical protein